MKMNYDPAPMPEREGSERVEMDIDKLDLPAWFRCAIISAQEKTAKVGSGRYLDVGFKMAEGPCAGAAFWQGFTTSNSSAQAVRIGIEQMKALMYATGLPKGADSDALKGKECLVRCVIEESKGYAPKVKGNVWRPAGPVPEPEAEIQEPDDPDEMPPAATERERGWHRYEDDVAKGDPTDDSDPIPW